MVRVGNLCLVPELSQKTCSFSLLSMMLTVALSYMAIIMLRYVFSIITLLRVFTIKDVEFCHMLFSVYVQMFIWFLSFILLM